MQLVRTKGDSRFPGAYVVSDDYYIEMVDGKETVSTGSLIRVSGFMWNTNEELTGKIFRFTIDHDANPYGKAPCF